MKTLHIFLAITMAFSAISISNAQTNSDVNETVKVWGNCSMCQSRIEKAAKEAGATSAKWDEETKLLSVSYAPSNTSLKKIEEKIASVGHDTQNIGAGNNVYNKLPGCCKYERKTASEDAAAMPCCNDKTKCAGMDCSKETAGRNGCCKSSDTKMNCSSKEKNCCSK